MLKIRNLLVLVLFFMALNASARINDLVVFCNDGEPFILIMNGQRYNTDPKTRVEVRGLDLARYSVKIIFSNKKIKELNTTLTFYDDGYECLFALNRHGKKYSMDYLSSKSLFPEQEENTPATNTTTTTTTTPTSTPAPNPNSTNSVSVNTGLGNVGVNENGGISIGGKNGNVNVNTKNPSGNVAINVGGQTVNLNKAQKSNCSSPMNAIQFDDIKKKVESYTDEGERLAAAKLSLENNCFTTSQVKTMMGFLKEDSSKMELAKKSYSHVNDLNNIKSLKDSFSKEASKQEFLKFVQEMK